METVKPGYPSALNVASGTVVELDRITRWDVYNRLQELSIPCECKCGESLLVQVDNAAVALQLWSVVQLFTAPKQTMVDRLERCWKQRSK